MTLLHYSQTHFLKDLELLDYTFPTPSQTLNFLKPHITPKTRFFGGAEWENMENDLSKVKIENRKYFCICLFTMVCADENMYAYFKENYEAFNSLTKYPKFGWLGFGINFEKPCYLIIAPKEINFDSIPELEIKEFIHHQFTISSHFLEDITPNQFFTVMINDIHFNCECEIFRRLLHCMKTELF